jgi:hypothetical protein
MDQVNEGRIGPGDHPMSIYEERLGMRKRVDGIFSSLLKAELIKTGCIPSSRMTANDRAPNFSPEFIAGYYSSSLSGLDKWSLSRFTLQFSVRGRLH